MGHDLIPFTIDGQDVERRHHEGQEVYSVVDVVAGLGITDPAAYWRDLKRREKASAAKDGQHSQIVGICHGLKRKASDGKSYLSDYATRESIIFIIEKIPSSKADAWKMAFARIVEQRLQEEADPEKGLKRIYDTYRRNGRADRWIQARFEGVTNRKALAAEWKNRGLHEGEYGKLTNLIGKEAFGLEPAEHRAHKGLPDKQNLRDHMNELELKVQDLAETAARTKHVEANSFGFGELAADCRDAGRVAATAIRGIEKMLGRPVVTNGNNLGPATIPLGLL